MTLSTRVSVRQEALRRAGGFVEDLTSVGDTTSIISNAMRYRFSGDDDAGKGMLIYDPADAVADEFRVVTIWDDSAGDATVDTMAGAKTGTETVEYYLRNDPTPYEFDTAINRVLSETKRIVETVIPTIKGGRHYTLLNLPWIDKRDDIVNVLIRRSPSFIDNSQFELWGRGQDAQLHAWVLSGTDATVTRVDGLDERFAVRVTSTGGNGAVATQTIPIPITQLYGETLNLFGRIKSSTAAMASIDVTDGTDTTQSTQHDGGGDWDEFTVEHAVNADAQGPLQVKLTLDATDGSADFENVVGVKDDSVIQWLQDYGDQHTRASSIRWSPQMRGSLPVIVTDQTYDLGSQLVVQSRQRYFELTADSGTGGVTDMPFEALVAGTLVKLAETHAVGKPNAARWEAIGSYWLPKYQAWRRALGEVSEQPTPNRNTIRSA